MIENLTPEQEAQTSVYRDRWLAHGLSCEPADRPTAEIGVRLAYEAADLVPPTDIRWADSPLAGARIAAQLAEEKENVTNEEVTRQLGQAIYGQHEAGWLGFYEFFEQVCGIEACSKLRGLQTVAKSAGWWWAFSEAAVVTERPSEMHRDQLNRLHNPSGPALRYPDGFAVYAWNGTRTPRSLIEDGWTTTQIFAEQNAEIRRCAIERIGWDKFIVDAKLKQVGKSVADPGNPGMTLELYDVPEQIYDEAVRVLLCTNGTIERDGTRRRFGLTTPATVKDPIEAAAWTYSLSKKEYLTAQRRA